MKIPSRCILVVAAQFFLAAFTASAHPGSGIVVDTQGNVYFTHLGRGVGKIDPQGKLTYVGHTRGGHWMCLDPDEEFAPVPERPGCGRGRNGVRRGRGLSCGGEDFAGRKKGRNGFKSRAALVSDR